MRCSVSACFFQEGRDSFEKQRSFAVGLDNLYRASTLSSCIAQCAGGSAMQNLRIFVASFLAQVLKLTLVESGFRNLSSEKKSEDVT